MVITWFLHSQIKPFVFHGLSLHISTIDRHFEFLSNNVKRFLRSTTKSSERAFFPFSSLLESTEFDACEYCGVLLIFTARWNFKISLKIHAHTRNPINLINISAESFIHQTQIYRNIHWKFLHIRRETKNSSHRTENSGSFSQTEEMW